MGATTRRWIAPLLAALAGGTVLVNAVLARKWGLPAGPESGWRRIR